MSSWSRIAIVNRGEAARRLIRAVREHNFERERRLETIALVTPPDRDAPFAREADRVVALEPPPGKGAVAAYLDSERVIEACRGAGADAVWVGWGFVSEDPAFNARVRAAGLRFIGPSPEAMRLAGDKVEAKRLAERVGVPVVPWSGTPVETLATATAVAESMGYPIALKAAAGGGGRGIRVVESVGELARAYETARLEAERAFGDGRLFIERCVSTARHLEVQIAGDAHGNVVAFGVRDCTIQRRHQKLVEESPGPLATPALAAQLERYAVAFARAAAYESLGTVEFIYDCETATPYFMEMNARLQVEHPVTELVYGIDLVKTQLDIASGASLEDVRPMPRGAAIEVRLNAEDPDNDFAPAPGRVRRFALPEGPGLRVDAGVVAGSHISPEFDSMIAKIIAYGSTRAEALSRLRRALDETAVQIEGGVTNKGLLARILAHGDFARGNITTRWLDRARAAGTFDDASYRGEALIVAAVLGYRVEAAAALVSFQSAVARGVPLSLPESGGKELSFQLGGSRVELRVYCVGHERFRVQLGSGEWAVELTDDGAGGARVLVGGTPLRVLYEITETEIVLDVQGVAHRVRRDGGGVVRAPSPCLVIDVAVREGDIVAPGDRLASVEAMKMEMPLVAREAGKVARVLVQANMHAAAGQPLLMIAPREQEGAVEVKPALEPPRVEAPPAPDVIAELRPDAPLDAGEAGARRARAAAIVEELTRIFCGYDTDDGRIERLQAVVASPQWAKVRQPADFASLGQALQVFVDIERLFSTALATTGPGPAQSMQMAYYAYARRLARGNSEAPESLAPALRRALAHYGIDDLAASSRLSEALLRMAMAHGAKDTHRARVHQLVSSLLATSMQLHRAGADFSRAPGLEETLEQLPLVAGRKYPFVADTAYQARYLLFQQRRFERRPAERVAFVEDGLRHLATLARPSQPAAARELARTREPIAAVLAAATRDGDPSVRRHAAEVLYRRLYDEDCEVRIAARPLDGDTLLVIERNARAVPLRIFAVAHLRTLQATLEAVAEAARAAADVSVDVVVHDADAEDESLVEAARALVTGDGGIARLCFVVPTGEVLRFRAVTAAAAEPCRGVHPEAARRLELWRLASFELTEVSANEHLIVYQGRARSNPADQRLFVVGEIRHVPEGTVRAEGDGLSAFDYTYFEAIRALREAQARRSVRDRLHGNRIILHVGPMLVARRRDVMRVAEALSAHRSGLGLESVTVRARMAHPDRRSAAAVDSEIHVSNPTGHKLEVRVGAPSTEPIPAATPYELKLERARALDMPYPYEVIRMLTSDAAVISAEHFPPGRFVEYDLHPSSRTPRAVPVGSRPYGENRAGVVFGLITHQTEKHPEGMERVIMLSDPVRGMGSLAEPECARIIAALDLAEQRGVPVEWVPISSGAHIAMDSGTENLDWTARVLRRIIEVTQAGVEVNVIVDGVNVGAQSYFNAEATMLMHTRGVLVMTARGAMVLTGKRALDYSGGISAEDERGIGGVERVMGPNGQAQYFARDLAHAFQILFEHYRFTYRTPGEERVRAWVSKDAAARDCMTAAYPAVDEGFATVGDVFSMAHNPERKKPFAMRALMDAVMDADGGALERFAFMRNAEVAVIRDCHLGGEPVCMIGIESRPIPRQGYVPGDGPDAWTGGTLFPQSSKKVARAINAASGNRPVVVLANLSGFDGSPESMRKLQLEYGAEIGRAVVNFRGPIVFAVVARYHGGAYVVFSKALNDELHAVALEGSYASVIGGAPAAAVVFSGQVRAETERDTRVVAARKARDAAPAEDQPRLRAEYARVHGEVLAEKQAELARTFDRVHSVERACTVGSLDEVIPPPMLRARLIELVRREDVRPAAIPLLAHKRRQNGARAVGS